MLQLIGLRIVAIKGLKDPDGTLVFKNHKKRIEPYYVFFNDGETYMILEEQDQYTYHDCSASARNLNVFKNKAAYDIFFAESPDANVDL